MQRGNRVYIGTYTEPIQVAPGRVLHRKGRGIYRLLVDSRTGRTELAGLTEDVKNPSYLCMNPNGRFLYAVNELAATRGMAEGLDGDSANGGGPGEPGNTTAHGSAGHGEPVRQGGAVSSFAVDPASGELEFLNRQPTYGDDPCHLSIDGPGHIVVVSNYTSGSVCVLPVRRDGSLGEPSSVIGHSGASSHPERQNGPHAHGGFFDRSGRFLFVADLGIDRVVGYRYVRETGAITEVDGAGIAVKSGTGPRHLAFSPDGAFVYVLGELDSTIAACSYETETGCFRHFQTVSAVPKSFRGSNACAAVRIHPSGRFLYVSNRGHDSITVFHRGSVTGELTQVGYFPTGGADPRDFALNRSGEVLLAANQSSDCLVTFLVDSVTGALTAASTTMEIGAPVCVCFPSS